MNDVGLIACPVPRLAGFKDVAPGLYEKFIEFSTYFAREGKIERRLNELVRLRIAQLNQCHY
jgi:alkylhydroperoxidase family enzyme